MFQPDQYIAGLTARLQSAWHSRLMYVGLQGSYLRGEATESSDIDIMVVVDALSPADLHTYRQAIEAMEGFDLSCGFICGLEELQHWNPLELCHLLHTTKDYLGTLKDLLPPYTDRDVRTFVQMSLGNLYHEICHRYIHAPAEHNVHSLPGTCKAVFFILQNLHYLRSGRFIGTKKELLSALGGKDKAVLETALALGCGEPFDFDEAFSLLFNWCKETMAGL